jgi:transcriptional regulator with XRE-family HTH domain
MGSTPPACPSHYLNVSALRAVITSRWPSGGQRQFAKAIGFSESYVSQILHGLRPSAEARRRIAEAIGSDAACQVFGSGDDLGRLVAEVARAGVALDAVRHALLGLGLDGAPTPVLPVEADGDETIGTGALR